MHYVGFHKGTVNDIYDFTYWHSSTNLELNKALQNAYKIIFLIIDYGSVTEMQTLEYNKLKEVNAKQNPKYFNKSNGGGKGVKAAKGHNKVDIIYSNLLDKKYDIKFHSKDDFKKLIEEKRDIQVRIQTNTEHIQRLRGNMFDPNASHTHEPAVLLMSSSKNISESKLIGGNHSVRAMIGAPHMNGLMAHEVPYKDWKDLTPSDLRLLGLQLNPRHKNPRKEAGLDDIAQWAADIIEERQLYKNASSKDKNEKSIPWTDHPDVVAGINSIAPDLTPAERGAITKKLNAIFDDKHRLTLGHNFIDWSVSGLAEDKNLEKWYNSYCDNIRALKPYDAVIKISSGQHIWSQIEKSFYEYQEINNDFVITDHPKKILVLIYFYKMGHDQSNEWKKSYQNYTYAYNKAYKNIVTIDTEFLPQTTEALTLLNGDDTNA